MHKLNRYLFSATESYNNLRRHADGELNSIVNSTVPEEAKTKSQPHNGIFYKILDEKIHPIKGC